MIPKECKRLAEVDFPIAIVGRHSTWEKNNFPEGHPKSLHQWWARRPLGACRAVLLGLLLPDPCDKHCPKEFKAKARELLRKAPGRLGTSDESLREALLKFVGDFSGWDLSSNATYLEVGRGLVKAAHPEETPLVVDPFSGGGSIPQEALRLGCESFASDLNPVACLILKVMLEDIPRHGHQLTEELRRFGKEVSESVEKELTQYYPSDPDGGHPVAYLWARTVRCESPNCGAEIPLARSLWLSKRDNRKRALRYAKVEPRKGPPRIEFEIYMPRSDDSVQKGTVSRANATCPCCNIVLPAARVRVQLAAQRGGADVTFDKEGNRIGGAILLAVVAVKKGISGQEYRLPTDRDYTAVCAAQKAVTRLSKSAVPDEPLPPVGTLGFRVQRYGMLQWGDLFTARQKLGCYFYCNEIAKLKSSDNKGTADLLALAVGKLAGFSSSLCAWNQTNQNVANTFGRQALPIVWDFAETNLVGPRFVTFPRILEYQDAILNYCTISTVIPGRKASSQVQVVDACKSPLPDSACHVWFTDPPYYDAVPYADLSDFFFVWLKRSLPNNLLLRDPFDPENNLTPKIQEIVQDESKQVDGCAKDRSFFEREMCRTFEEGRRVLREEGIACVVFAHKTTEGWEALLSGMLRGGWTVTASWPIATERPGRLRAQNSAALAASIHLICRPRTEDTTGDWTDVSRELPGRVKDWMERLEKEGVRGADLVFACIGPALEIYSRYAKVVDAQDREIPLGGDPEAKEPYKRGYLAYVWETVGRIALEQVLGSAEAQGSAAGTLEEDARLTALFLWTLQSTETELNHGDAEDTEEEPEETEDEESPKKRAKGLSLVFDVVRRFAQPLGIHLPDWESRIIETDKGVVRLLPVDERSEQLFGEDGAQAIASRLEREARGDAQMVLFPERQDAAAPQVRGRRRGRRAAGGAEEPRAERAATTLDRIHAAMLLQASGKSNALRSMLKAEHERGPDFLRLANSLSALYPKTSQEKRLLDAMLLAMPR